MLKVGPRSAGANPGPVCYGLGNQEPTVTDANVVLGVLNQTHLLNGRMAIDAAASRRAMERLAQDLGIGVMEAAHGVLRVVTANMAKAIRVVSVERGYDPRDYSILAFGGAGPLHAARLARELDIPRVIVPKFPGVMCATGLVQADLRSDFSLTCMTRLDAEGLTALKRGFEGLEARAEDWFAAEDIPADRRRRALRVDMRCKGQGYELTIDWPEGVLSDADALAALRARFNALHSQLYGYEAGDAELQATAIRVEATGVVPKVETRTYPDATKPVGDAVIGERSVWDEDSGAFVACPLYDRSKLGPGHRVAGPAVIEQMDSTTYVLAGQTATVDAFLNLMLEATR